MNRWRLLQIIFTLVSSLVHTALNAQPSRNPFPYFDFDPSDFKNPSREFGDAGRTSWAGKCACFVNRRILITLLKLARTGHLFDR